MSDGSYGVPKEINFSFPVEIKDGKYKIIQGLKWDEHYTKMIEKTTQELLEEQKMALDSLK